MTLQKAKANNGVDHVHRTPNLYFHQSLHTQKWEGKRQVWQPETLQAYL